MNDASVYTTQEIPVTCTIAELSNIIGLGRNNTYALVRSGRIRSIRVTDHLVRIPREAVLEFLAGETAKGGTKEQTH